MAEDSSAFSGFTESAQAGDITLDSGIADRCASECQAIIDQLISIQNQIGTLGSVKGFGNGVDNAAELATRFQHRATGGDRSLDKTLENHIEIVNEMKQTFIESGRAYLQTEEGSADALSAFNEKYPSDS